MRSNSQPLFAGWHCCLPWMVCQADFLYCACRSAGTVKARFFDAPFYDIDGFPTQLAVTDPFPIDIPPYTTTHKNESTTNILAHFPLNRRISKSPRGSSTPLRVGHVHCRSIERVSMLISTAPTGKWRIYRQLL